jgi:hypothetical protein
MSIQVGMWNHGGDWKSGVKWDVVSLQRVGPNPNLTPNNSPPQTQTQRPVPANW